MVHSSEDALIPTASAVTTVTSGRPTGRLRWLSPASTTCVPPKLQQEWELLHYEGWRAIDSSLEWRDVPYEVDQ